MRCRIKRKVAIKRKCNDEIGVGLLVTAYVVGLLNEHRVQGEMYLWTSFPRAGNLFYRRALNLPFTDKGIQACRLKGSTAALGQSVVCRYT